MELSFVYATPVRILQQLIDSREFQELLAYAKNYGLPTALLAATVANGAGGKKGVSPADFLPQPRRKAMSPMKAQAMVKAQLKQRGTI